MQPDKDYKDYTDNSDDKEEAREYPLYNYDYPSDNNADNNPDKPYNAGEDTDYDTGKEFPVKSNSELEDENEDLRKANEGLQSSARTAKTMAVVFGILTLLSVGYIFFSHFNAPLFGPMAGTKNELTAQTAAMEKLKAKTDTLQRSNDILVEQQPEVQDGVFFEVQLGAFQNFNLDEYQADFASLRQDGDVTRKFTFGKFRSYDKAEKLKSDLQRMGVGGAFVVARVNGQRTEDIKEAVRLSNAR